MFVQLITAHFITPIPIQIKTFTFRVSAILILWLLPIAMLLPTHQKLKLGANYFMINVSLCIGICINSFEIVIASVKQTGEIV